jgi:hypothetical protein
LQLPTLTRTLMPINSPVINTHTGSSQVWWNTWNRTIIIYQIFLLPTLFYNLNFVQIPACRCGRNGARIFRGDQTIKIENWSKFSCISLINKVYSEIYSGGFIGNEESILSNFKSFPTEGLLHQLDEERQEKESKYIECKYSFEGTFLGFWANWLPSTLVRLADYIIVHFVRKPHVSMVISITNTLLFTSSSSPVFLITFSYYFYHRRTKATEVA